MARPHHVVVRDHDRSAHSGEPNQHPGPGLLLRSGAAGRCGLDRIDGDHGRPDLANHFLEPRTQCRNRGSIRVGGQRGVALGRDNPGPMREPYRDTAAEERAPATHTEHQNGFEHDAHRLSWSDRPHYCSHRFSRV